MIKKLLLTLLLLLFVGCTKPQEKELILSTNTWIGYAPLFYAKEKGYLDALNIKLITSVSLGESANIFLVSKAHLVTATQHEYNILKNEVTSIVPIILLDRSNGGDMILSNRSLEELLKSKHIDVYLEVDSINKELIEYYTRQNRLDENVMHYINKDQGKIQNIIPRKDRDIIVVTYTPNNIALEKAGFKELASTAKSDTLLVIDAIFTKKETLRKHKSRLQALKTVIDKSIQEIQNDPKSAHALTQKYLNNLSYEEFSSSLKSIEWINLPSDELLIKIEALDYKKENLLL